MSDNQSTSAEQLTAEELLEQFAEELHAQYLYDSYSGNYYQLRGEILRRMAAPQGGPSADGWVSVKDFIRLWDSINAKRGYGWDKNPWVWVIEFKLATAPFRVVGV